MRQQWTRGWKARRRKRGTMHGCCAGPRPQAAAVTGILQSQVRVRRLQWARSVRSLPCMYARAVRADCHGRPFATARRGLQLQWARPVRSLPLLCMYARGGASVCMRGHVCALEVIFKSCITMAARLGPHASEPAAKRRTLEDRSHCAHAPGADAASAQGSLQPVAKQRTLEDRALLRTACGAWSQAGGFPGKTGGVCGEHKRCQGTVAYAPYANATVAQDVLVRAVSWGARVRRRVSPPSRTLARSPAMCSAPRESAVGRGTRMDESAVYAERQRCAHAGSRVWMPTSVHVGRADWPACGRTGGRARARCDRCAGIIFPSTL